MVFYRFCKVCKHTFRDDTLHTVGTIFARQHVHAPCGADTDAVEYYVVDTTFSLQKLYPLDIVKAFGEANGIEIPYVIADRRPGDVAECYADPKKALEGLGWKAEKSVEQMCADTWRWQKNNPNGYN